MHDTNYQNYLETIKTPYGIFKIITNDLIGNYIKKYGGWE